MLSGPSSRMEERTGRAPAVVMGASRGDGLPAAGADVAADAADENAKAGGGVDGGGGGVSRESRRG